MNKKNTAIFLLSFCVLFFVYQYGIRSAVPSVLNEELQSYFSISATQLGSLISLFYLAYTIMQIPVGLIIDRMEVKKIAVITFSLFSFGIILLVYSQSYIFAAISQIFLGCSSSFAFVLIMKVTNDYFPSDKVALISSIAISIGSLGPVICSPTLTYLSSVFYWKNVLICMGILGFIFSFIGLIFLKNTSKVSNIEISNEKSIFQNLKIISSNNQYIWIGIFSMMVLGSISTFTDAWGISFIRYVYGYTKEQSAFAISLVFLGNILGGPVIAHISHILQSYKKVMLCGSVILLVLFCCIIFINMPIYILYPILFLTGAVVSCQFLAFPYALLLVSKELGATITGVVNTITMLGSTFLIPGVGFILDLSKGNNTLYSASDYQISMSLLIVSVIIAILTMLFIQDKYPKNNSL